jgi:hypothetical protein
MFPKNWAANNRRPPFYARLVTEAEGTLQQEWHSDWGGPSVKESDVVRDSRGFEGVTRRQSGQGFGSEGQIRRAGSRHSAILCEFV